MTTFMEAKYFPQILVVCENFCPSRYCRSKQAANAAFTQNLTALRWVQKELGQSLQSSMTKYFAMHQPEHAASGSAWHCLMVTEAEAKQSPLLLNKAVDTLITHDLRGRPLMMWGPEEIEKMKQLDVVVSPPAFVWNPYRGPSPRKKLERLSRGKNKFIS